MKKQLLAVFLATSVLITSLTACGEISDGKTGTEADHSKIGTEENDPGNTSEILDDTVNPIIQAYRKQLSRQIAGYEEGLTEAEAKKSEARRSADGSDAYKEALYESVEITEQKLEIYSSMLVEIDKLIEQEQNYLLTEENEQNNADGGELLLSNDLLKAAEKFQDEILADLSAVRTEYKALLLEAKDSDSLYPGLMPANEQKKLAAKLTELEIDAELVLCLAGFADQEPQDGEKAPAAAVFGWPLTDYYYISSHFGRRMLDGSYEYHAATDIAAGEGAPICAAGSGTVVRSEWNDYYGYYVLIDHGNGRSTLYAHQSQPPFVVEGDKVAYGQEIGLVGNTGYSFGARLHFEFRIGGERVDAEQYMTPPHQ